MILVGKTPIITTVNMTSGGTEYSFTLPVSTKKFIMQCRSDDEILFAFNTGDIGSGTYMTIPEGASHSEDNITVSGSGLTIFVQSTSDNVVLECLYWRTV